jgi:hypothetical protein
VGADDAPFRAAYPAEALINELKRHGDDDSFMLIPSSGFPDF